MDVKFVVTIPYLGAFVPENVSVNVWSFNIQDNEESDLAEIGQFVQVFYSTMLGYLSPILNAREVRYAMYDRADPEPQTPFATGVIDLGEDTGNDPLPEEVAICLSFKAQYASGQPSARRRGRIFFGPVNDAAIAVSNSRTIVNPAFTALLITAVTDANAELVTVGNNHSIWSPTDGVGRNVDSYWVDNAFDTQRRRGLGATIRQPFTV